MDHTPFTRLLLDSNFVSMTDILGKLVLRDCQVLRSDLVYGELARKKESSRMMQDFETLGATRIRIDVATLLDVGSSQIRTGSTRTYFFDFLSNFFIFTRPISAHSSLIWEFWDSLLFFRKPGKL